MINKSKKEEDIKNNINNDVDFFMDDSSESENYSISINIFIK